MNLASFFYQFKPFLTRFLDSCGEVGLRAKRIGLVNEIKPILDDLQNVEFRIRDTLYNEALRLADEK